MAGGNNSNNNDTQPAGGTDPAIVGIGASAGGVQALQSFFSALPDNTGAAFVVVVHLDPQHHSELSSILAARTPMPVVQVEKTEKLQADRVYVIPPNRRLRLDDHEISALAFDEPHGQRAPIDLFLRSLAERGAGFAVILSGGGSDGTFGVRAVKAAGGIILVQDPDEAEFPSMPRNAIATGFADLVLPVREIAERLAELIRGKATSAADETQIDDSLLRRILAQVRARTGHDFSKYKRATVLRRIARRMQVNKTDNFVTYIELLRDSEHEAQALMADLLISVTTFFRDKEVFEAVATQVVPSIFEGRSENDSVRVWIPGCATGEEAYSIAMLLLEEASRREERPPIQVFASDLDNRALSIGREGVYPVAIEADVSQERLRRFFTREKDVYRVRQELRDTVLFASHDLLKDPPFSRIDLISCRNLLIYLDRESQEQVCSTLYYALNPGGFLVLGQSEIAENPPGLFRAVDRNFRIYQTTAPRGERPRLPAQVIGDFGLREPLGHFGRVPVASKVLNEAAAHREAIERLAPPSIMVDEAHRVLHLSDNAGRYVQPAGGPFNSDVVELVRPELRFELRSALHRVFEQHQPTLSLPILVRFNGSQRRVHLWVKPARDDENSEPRNAIVMFIEGESVGDIVMPPGQQPATDDTVRRLTEELELTQARLRTVREELENANEELRAANEELQSINEEYRSTSEELETSKEELQSINEELTTVNAELKFKLDTISRAHSDLQNLMAASDVGTLFLDTGLHIKLFTERVTDLFSITKDDEGRPITDFAHQLDYDGLIKDIRSVLADLAPIRREIRHRDGRWYDVRLRPYRTVEGKIDGVVITFVDVSDLLNAEEALRQSRLTLQEKRLIDLSRDPIFVWDFDGGILEWNRGSEELYGYSAAEAIGKVKNELLDTSVPDSSFEELKAALLRDGHWSGELQQKAKDGHVVTVESGIHLEQVDGRRLVLESTRDIGERKIWERQQHLLLGELTHRVKNTLAIVQSIANQTMRSTRSREDFVTQFGGRLAALATAHDLLVQSDWGGADFEALARAQLEPHVSGNPERLHIEGQAVLLPANIATPFGLVLHELAANAAKYGALSADEGKVDLHWRVSGRNNGRRLTVAWKETGGPPPKRSVKSGFGSVLIDKSIPNATVRREFRREGLICTITLPLPEAGETEGGHPA